MGIVAFLGAGFCVPAGLPVGAGLFDGRVFPHSVRAGRDVEAVLGAWEEWQQEHPSAASEEFVSHVYETDLPRGGAAWMSLVRFLGYRIAGTFATFYRYEGATSRSRDNIFEARVCDAHRLWWDLVLGQTERARELIVITTNWDISIERALRPRPMRHPFRPGFHYGWGPEQLRATTGYPRSRWREQPSICGSVPVLKLHGSLNWAVEHGSLVKYGDLRPAFRGDAAIVPPLKHKRPPAWADELWEQARHALAHATVLLVVGYSFPEYDERIRQLFREGLEPHQSRVHVFDPNADHVSARLARLVPDLPVSTHSGLPDGLRDVERTSRQVD